MKFLLIIFLAMNIQSFKVIDMQDSRINEMIDEAFKHEICYFNSATIHYLKSNEYLVTPSEGKYAILYSDLNLLKKHIEDKYFPIEKLESNSIYEVEKLNIEDIENKDITYINYILDKFNLEQNKKINDCSIETQLNDLNDKINSYGCQNLSNYDILAIGIYVSHLFKIETSSSWQLNKVHTLNTYWTPSIISKENIKHDIIGNIFNTIYEHDFVDLIYSYRKEMAKFHGLKKPLSKEYLSYISTGILNKNNNN
ncbi:hypothetical protein CJ739_1430 [Mariniflexile rhizosphaerae]|uniref:hypothetical protein n=1 Tax=unclassified Mariniflexile TaxID=2643887 RepID=UPI000CC44330|nr:hypothetical protein [Mariniflexile sp. TRM1-10]AXP80519.1 hypothetical protein CJ739_1430 [Mariniflexile sp. TRM1-10]PLB20061.1 MAG: hypothetical protein TRG1_1006 [Flavobacteriaceae bacterium FS1-H7996/R]